MFQNVASRFIRFVFVLMLVCGALGASPAAAQSESEPWFYVWLARYTGELWDIHGYGWPMETAVTMTLDRQATPDIHPDYTDIAYMEVPPWGGDPQLVFDISGMTASPGDVVTMSDGTTTLTHTITDLAVTLEDVIHDKIAGTAAPGSDVFIGGGWGGYRHEFAALNGTWLADFSVAGNEDGETVADLGDNDNVIVSQPNGGGDTAYGWNARIPRFMLRDLGSVTGWFWPLDSQVTLSIDDPATTVVDPDYTETQTSILGGTDRSRVTFDLEGKVEVHPGFEITLSGAGMTKTMTVPTVAVNAYDLGADTISGIADPFTSLGVPISHLDDDSSLEERTVTADADGKWSVDFSQANNAGETIFDVQAGDDFEPQIFDADWDHTVITLTLADPTISGTVRDLSGNAITGVPVRVDVEDASGELGELAGTCSDPATGAYALSGLPVGGPALAVQAAGNDIDCAGDSTFYGWEYWGHATELPQATPISLTVSNPTVTGINLRLGEAVPVIEFLAFNLEHPIMDESVRKAIAHGTNRLHILNTIWLPAGEYGTVENSYVADNHWAKAPDSSLPVYSYDPSLARSILDADGWLVDPATGIRKKGGQFLTLALKTTGLQARRDAAALFADEMAAIGIDVSLEFMPGPAFFGPTGPLATGNFDIGEYAYNFCRNTVDEYCVPPTMYHTGAANNYARYSAPDADAEYAAVQAATTHADRLTHVVNHQAIVMNDLPYLPLFTRVVPITISGNAGAGGVTLSYTDGMAKSVISAADGSYHITIPMGWSGTLTPSLPGYIFTPAAITYSKVTSNISAKNYAAHALVTAALRSTPAQDGWIRETTETSTMGGILDATGPTLRLGDEVARQQYRSILSFATGAALPDSAVITGATLVLRRQGITGGGNPITMFQGLFIDVRTGFFGTGAALQPADFQVNPATKKITVGPYKPVPVGAVYTIVLPASVFPYINKLSAGGGLTQLRLRFKLDDNNNLLANYISFFSGNYGNAGYRPRLTITYYLP